MGYSAKAIANYLLDNSRRRSITPMKLQKLVYLAHGWWLGMKGKPLVDDEFAEAWTYGPVFPSLLQEFNAYGNSPISTKAKDIDNIDDAGNVTFKTPEVDPDDSNVIVVLNTVLEAYGKSPGTRLSEITQDESAPWATTRNHKPVYRNTHIPNEMIEKYYRGLIDKWQDADREVPHRASQPLKP